MADYDVLGVSVSISEGDIAWQFEAHLAHVEDYQLFERGQDIVVSINDDEYNMFITNKELTRDGPASVNMVIRGSSPILKNAPPFAPLVTKTYDSAMLVKDIVEDLLGVTISDWTIPNWTLPAYKAAIEQGNPIDLATQIVEAAGGVIESMPDGSVRVRSLFPVAVPDFDTASITFTFTDVEHNISTSEGFEPVTGYNVFRIKEGDAAYEDRLEYIEDEPDPLTGGTIKVYLSPWRINTVLEHTWTTNFAISLQFIEEEIREEESLVEFVAGEGSTDYPIMSITNVEWESLPLTGLTFEPYTSTIKTSSITDYGLAKITYNVRTLNYKTSQPIDSDVQYILRNT